MNNKRVYLAKSNLASGFDVEYVKSNLLRIPGIEVIEYSSGIDASECACIVYVPEEGIDFSNGELSIGRSATRAISEFVEHHPTADVSNVYIYTGNEETDRCDGDRESTTPMALYCNDFCANEGDDEGILYFDDYADCRLLEYVSDDIYADDNFAWKKIPRHYKPAPEYAMPDVAPVQERESAKSAKYIAPHEAYIQKGRRPLLGLRKARRKS